jgi:hypothetical protein
MEYIILTFAILILLFFIFVTARQAKRETRYYEWIAEQDDIHYQQIENSTFPERNTFYE